MNHEDVRAEVEQHHQQYKAEAIDKAKGLAEQERPSTPAEVFLYINEIRAKYQGRVRMVNTGYHPRTHSAMGQVEVQITKQETTELDEEIADKRHRLQVHQMDTPRHGETNVPLRAIIVTIITAIVFTAQGLWESGAFLVTGETRTRATLIGIGVTIAFALFAHTAVYIIRRIRRRPWKIMVGVLTVVTAFVGYWVIGTFRAQYLTEFLEYSEGLNLDPWMFAVLSLVMFFAVGALSLAILPSIEQVEEYREQRKMRKEQERMVREVKDLEAERKAMPRRFAENLKGNAKMMEAAGAMKLHIRELYLETCLTFVQTNVSRRRSDPPTELFNDPPELDLEEQ